MNDQQTQQNYSVAPSAGIGQTQRQVRRRGRPLEHGIHMGVAVWFCAVLMILIIRISLFLQGVHVHPLILVRDILGATAFASASFCAVYVLSVDWHKRIMWVAEWRALWQGAPPTPQQPVELGEVINLKRQMFKVGKTNMVLLPGGVSLDRLHGLIKANVESGRKMKGDKVLSARALAALDVLPQSDFSKYNKFMTEHGLVEPAGKSRNAGMMLTQKGQTCFRVNVEGS